ncbi:hypothetical protein [Chroococcidiopsis sp. CCNUC1]|uniref:hypothetical protein n=1 Tax=Chroococcidiopsis sp. CCNUC1 TaxID=2653189 RepID=UPI0015E7B746|nr:hypothetical protein [Chroococcidiopsis sp. CCNUC1]URD50417.1 hypothetical protein M5J74_00105 [Chroococcidiopsis sp. CCNUC1]
MKSQNFFTDRSRLPSTGAQHPLSTPDSLVRAHCCAPLQTPDSLVRAHSIPYRPPTP